MTKVSFFVNSSEDVMANEMNCLFSVTLTQNQELHHQWQIPTCDKKTYRSVSFLRPLSTNIKDKKNKSEIARCGDTHLWPQKNG